MDQHDGLLCPVADDMDELVHAVKHAIQQCGLQVITPFSTLIQLSSPESVVSLQLHGVHTGHMRCRALPSKHGQMFAPVIPLAGSTIPCSLGTKLISMSATRPCCIRHAM